ncbi:MAG: hypothetical protein BA871_08875 [Desulfuromonadales bacterium C00003096]|jgi:hypothetical protein|nr:MAG: hypothetical protein BA871_08875 [Desulfuromonadales bacterium C00003096]
MKIKFNAKEVEYSEAIDGEIIQISFGENDSDDILENPYNYITISVNYEFPPIEPTIEWCDGVEFTGGNDIKSYAITNDSFQLDLSDNVSFDISFKTNEEKLKNIEAFLLDIFR